MILIFLLILNLKFKIFKLRIKNKILANLKENSISLNYNS